MSRTLRAPGGAWRAALLVALALAAAALAALTANPQRAEAAFTTGQCLGADITGRGASFARDAHLVFTQQFQGTFCQGSGPNITYAPDGSGAGRRAVGERTNANSTGTQSRSDVARFGMTDEAPSTTAVADINRGTDNPGDEDRIHVIPAAVGAAPPLVNFPDNCDVNLLPDASKTAEQDLDRDMVQDDVVRVRFTKAQLDAIFARDPASDNWTEVFPSLTADPDCNKPIIRVVRFDDSGTTFVFKDYLDRANPTRNWVPGFTDPLPARTRAWPAATFGDRDDCSATPNGVSEPSDPDGPGAEGDANGSVDQLTSACSSNAANLVATLLRVDGSIGYADLSTARGAGLAITPEANDNDTYWTQVQNGEGGTNASGPLAANRFTEPTADDNSFRTVDGANNPTRRGAKCQNTTFENVPADTFGDFVPTSGVNSPNGFGICSLTYGLLFDDYKRAYALNTDQVGEERKARTVKDYWTSIVSDGGQAVLFPQDYAPLPTGILAIARGGVNAVGFDKAATGGGGTTTPPVVTPVTPPGGGGTPPPVTPSNRFSVVRFTTRSRAGTGQFRVRVPGRGALSLSATARPGSKRIKVDAVRLSFSRSGTYSLNIKPGRVAKRVLKKRGKLRINVKITFTPRGGRARSITRTVTLRLTRSVRR